MKTLKIQLNESEIEVKVLPIGDYVELVKAIKRLPKHIQSLENLDVNKFVELLPGLMGDVLPDVIDLISIASKQEAAFIEKLGLRDIVKIVEGVFEVNDYAEVYQIVKKMIAHPTAKVLEGKEIKTL